MRSATPARAAAEPHRSVFLLAVEEEQMNGDNREGGEVVDVVLPGGTVVLVRVVENTGDGIGNVGLRDLNLAEALAEICEVASLVRDKIEPALPSRATVKFGVSFTAKSGKLAALVFEGKADASLTVSLEWERASHGEHSAVLK
jgi:Trypsin-co-occurring domain 1